jgi:glycosyltransferase involved in cell wall biosynthesis
MMIRSLYPVFNKGQGVSYTCLSLCEHMRNQTMQVQSWFPSSESHAKPAFVRDAYPRMVMPIVYRLGSPEKRLARAAERAFLRALVPGDVAYLWPGVSIETYQRIKDRGITILVERINCHTQYAKRLLDREYDRIGWPVTHEITDADVETEHRQLELADLVFAPNPFVVESLLEAGVASEKILLVSYGWDPNRMRGTTRAVEKGDGLDVLFVGRLCVRKGIHLLLEAWKKANIRGRLLFAGAVHFDVAERLAADLARPDVVQLGHTLDIGSVYRSADVFAFGSLEEGGPMVTYEAMGCGVPVIVSPMGAVAARDGIDGFVRDPHDIDGWVDALRQMAADAEMRKQMGRSARHRADEFTWEKVAARRREAVERALSPVRVEEAVGAAV